MSNFIRNPTFLVFHVSLFLFTFEYIVFISFSSNISFFRLWLFRLLPARSPSLLFSRIDTLCFIPLHLYSLPAP